MVDEAIRVPAEPPSGEPRPARPRLRLVGLSFLMLFVELALIRWTAANNIHLAYLTNFVLLASFLGIGIGFLRVGARPDLLPWTPVALALLVGVRAALPGLPSRLDGIDVGGRFGHGGAAALGGSRRDLPADGLR